MEDRVRDAWVDLYSTVLNRFAAVIMAELKIWLRLVLAIDDTSEFYYPECPADTIITNTTIDAEICSEVIASRELCSRKIPMPPFHVIFPEKIEATSFPSVVVCMVATRTNRPPCWFYMHVKNDGFDDAVPNVQTVFKVYYSEGGTFICGDKEQAEKIVDWIKDIY